MHQQYTHFYLKVDYENQHSNAYHNTPVWIQIFFLYYYRVCLYSYGARAEKWINYIKVKHVFRGHRAKKNLDINSMLELHPIFYSGPLICINKKHECSWPWVITVQICNDSISLPGSITSSGMSEDFPLVSLLLSSQTPVDSVSHRENSSSCITGENTV